MAVIQVGCALLCLVAIVDVIKDTLNNKEQKVGAKIVKRALTYPLKLLLENTDGRVVFEKVVIS